MTDIKSLVLSNGNTQHFKVVNNTYYEVAMTFKDGHKEEYPTVNDSLINVLESCRMNYNRVRVWLGDTKTGRSWNEEYDVTGYVGRSRGFYGIPLLVNNKRSYGGGALCVDAIIRIDDIKTKRTLWKVDNFHVEPMLIKIEEQNELPYRVMQKKDGRSDYDYNIANFKNLDSAERWIDFMEGKRYNK